MTRIKTGLAAVAVLLVAGVATPAAAQARGYVGFGGGVSIPVGDFADGVKLGWLGQVVAGVTGPSGMLGGRIDGTYGRIPSRAPGADTFPFSAPTPTSCLPPANGPPKCTPYFLAGVGFYNSKLSVGTATARPSLPGTAAPASRSTPAIEWTYTPKRGSSRSKRAVRRPISFRSPSGCVSAASEATKFDCDSPGRPAMAAPTFCQGPGVPAAYLRPLRNSD